MTRRSFVKSWRSNEGLAISSQPSINPGDAAIVGMFPKLSDWITENALIVREILA